MDLIDYLLMNDYCDDSMLATNKMIGRKLGKIGLAIILRKSSLLDGQQTGFPMVYLSKTSST